MQPDAQEIAAPDSQMGGGAYLLANLETGVNEKGARGTLYRYLLAFCPHPNRHHIKCAIAYSHLPPRLDRKSGVGKHFI